MEREAKYLGDGVYATISKGEDMVVLTTCAHYTSPGAKTPIYLEREVASQLVHVLENWLKGDEDASPKPTP